LSHVTVLIEALQNYFKKNSDLSSHEKASIQIFKWRNVTFLINEFVQNEVYRLLITVKRVDRVAARYHNTAEGYPVPLCAVEVYEINLWTIDNPAYRNERVTDFLEKTTEAVCSFFYNNPVFGREKSVNPHDTTVKQQHLYCNSILVTRTNEDLSDYKQQK